MYRSRRVVVVAREEGESRPLLYVRQEGVSPLRKQECPEPETRPCWMHAVSGAYTEYTLGLTPELLLLVYTSRDFLFGTAPHWRHKGGVVANIGQSELVYGVIRMGPS